MVRTMYSSEELEQEYDQANSDEEEAILQQMNELQLQCNMESSGESPIIVPDSVGSGSGAPEADPLTQSNYDGHMASSHDEESLRY